MFYFQKALGLNVLTFKGVLVGFSFSFPFPFFFSQYIFCNKTVQGNTEELRCCWLHVCSNTRFRFVSCICVGFMKS